MNKDKEVDTEEDLKQSFPKINFKEKRSKQFFRLFLKGVAFFTIAAITGGISGAYVSSKKNSTVIYPNSNSVKSDTSNQQGNDDVIIHRNEVSKALEKISPSIVQVHFNGIESSGGNEIEKIGNGIIYKPDGYILASYSTVKGSGLITAILPNNTIPISAKLIGFNEDTDIAIVKIDNKNLPYAKFGDITKVNIGDVVVAAGTSISIQKGNKFLGTSSVGIISSIGKTVEILDSKTNKTNLYNIFLTDASINAGNLAGPLCNLSGEIIGINCNKLGQIQGDVGGLGFALSISNVCKIIDDITNVGQISKAQIGIKGVNAVFKDKKINGVYIQEVVPSTGADSAGIKPADIIVEADNSKISNIDELKAVLDNHKVGDKISIKIWRNNKIIELNIILTEQVNNNI